MKYYFKEDVLKNMFKLKAYCKCGEYLESDTEKTEQMCDSCMVELDKHYEDLKERKELEDE